MRYLNGWHPFKSITFDQRVIQLSHVCNKHEKCAQTGVRIGRVSQRRPRIRYVVWRKDDP